VKEVVGMTLKASAMSLTTMTLARFGDLGCRLTKMVAVNRWYHADLMVFG
jgi:hypothetical protein